MARKTLLVSLLSLLLILAHGELNRVWPFETLYWNDLIYACPVPAGWTVLNGQWICGDEDLFGSGQSGAILATPVFQGCDLCSIHAGLEVTGSSRGSILAWYQDDSNYVSLTARREGNSVYRWTLRQVVNGKVAAKKSTRTGIPDEMPWEGIRSQIQFDGTRFMLWVLRDGPLIQLEKAPGSWPYGTVGFAYEHATMIRFAFIAVTNEGAP